MGQLVFSFKDGSTLEYDSGAFDQWCVYLTRPNQARYAPRDFQYFKRLTEYASKYGSRTLYLDFLVIYDKTTKTLNKSIFDEIVSFCHKYGDDETNIAIDFSIIYMGMVAEENKAFTRLGKRVKRLGVHQVLIDNMNYNVAANFSRGKKWVEIDRICKFNGF